MLKGNSQEDRGQGGQSSSTLGNSKLNIFLFCAILWSLWSRFQPIEIMQKRDKAPKCTWLQNPPVPEHLMRPLFCWIHTGETPVLEMKRSTGKLVTINCLTSACGCGPRDTSRGILASILVTLVSWVGNKGMWGRGNGLVSSSATSPTCRRTRYVGWTSALQLIWERRFFWAVDFNAGMTGP